MFHKFFRSGCVTSAESVLITQQSQEELYRVLQENEALVKVQYVCVVCVCVHVGGRVGYGRKSVLDTVIE